MSPLKKWFLFLFRLLSVLLSLGGLVCFVFTIIVLSDPALMPPDSLASGFFERIFNRPSFLMPFYIGMVACLFQMIAGTIGFMFAKEPYKAVRSIVFSVFATVFWLAYSLAFFGNALYGTTIAMDFYPYTVAFGFVLSAGFFFASIQYRRHIPRDKRDVNPMRWD